MYGMLIPINSPGQCSTSPHEVRDIAGEARSDCEQLLSYPSIQHQVGPLPFPPNSYVQPRTPPPVSSSDSNQNSTSQLSLDPNNPAVHVTPPGPAPAILIMGLTGAGKSTFISHLTTTSVIIGDTLNSCTKTIAQYPAATGLPHMPTVQLIDTPGFNDTYRNDTEILGTIAIALADLHNAKVPLAGVIYLHRISDTRMDGSSRKCLRLLEAIVGRAAYSHVMLVTNMWDSLQGDDQLKDAEGREKELLSHSEFWAGMRKGNAKVERLAGNRESAQKIVQAVVEMMMEEGSEGGVVLDIQRQMVEEHMELEKTTAGVLVDEGLKELQQRQEKALAELEQELQDIRDEVLRQQLEVEIQERRDKYTELEHARSALGMYKAFVGTSEQQCWQEKENINARSGISTSRKGGDMVMSVDDIDMKIALILERQSAQSLQDRERLIMEAELQRRDREIQQNLQEAERIEQEMEQADRQRAKRSRDAYERQYTQHRQRSEKKGSWGFLEKASAKADEIILGLEHWFEQRFRSSGSSPSLQQHGPQGLQQLTYPQPTYSQASYGDQEPDPLHRRQWK